MKGDRKKINYMLFELSEQDEKEIKEWDLCGVEHPYFGAAGGRLEYTFIPTSLGDIIKIKCLKCKKVLTINKLG